MRVTPSTQPHKQPSPQSGRRRHHPNVLGSVVLAGLLLSVFGCGRDGRVDGPEATPQFVSGGMAGGDAGSRHGGDRLEQKSGKKLIDDETGGVLIFDRYQLNVPPLALDWDCEYVITPAPGAIIEVNLQPHAVQFAKPVKLNIDLNGTTAVGQQNITLYWWDEANRRWVDVGGTWDPDKHILKSDLDHFSIYRPGRAGW